MGAALVTEPNGAPHIAQVAFSLPNVLPELRLFAGALGYQPTAARFLRGEVLERLQQLHDPVCLLWWLSGGAPFFQLELFQYGEPEPRSKPAGWRPSDAGYNLVSFAVGDVDATVTEAQAAGSRLRGGPADVADARRACLETPAGVLVELVQRAGAPLPAPLRAVRVVAPDMVRARAFYVEALGFPELGAGPEANPEREALWGLEGAKRELLTLGTSDGVRLELASYSDPQTRPIPDGYRLSDAGIMNVAVGYRDHADLYAVHERLMRLGCWLSSAPKFSVDDAVDVIYTKDAQGFSVELLYCPPERDAALGFATGQRAVQAGREGVR